MLDALLALMAPYETELKIVAAGTILLGSAVVSYLSYRRRWLTGQAALTACGLSVGLYLTGGLRLVVLLLTFFIGSTLLTHYRQKDKDQIEADVHEKKGRATRSKSSLMVARLADGHSDCRDRPDRLPGRQCGGTGRQQCGYVGFGTGRPQPAPAGLHLVAATCGQKAFPEESLGWEPWRLCPAACSLPWFMGCCTGGYGQWPAVGIGYGRNRPGRADRINGG